MCYFQPRSILYSDVLSFYQMLFLFFFFLFCSKVPSMTPQLHFFVYRLRFLLTVTVSQTSLIIDDLDSVEEDRCFVECPSSRICLVSFSWLEWEFGGRRSQRWSAIFNMDQEIIISMHTKSTHINKTHSSLLTSAWIIWLRWHCQVLHCKITFSPRLSFHIVLFRRKSLCAAHT